VWHAELKVKIVVPSQGQCGRFQVATLRQESVAMASAASRVEKKVRRVAQSQGRCGHFQAVT